MGGRAARRGKAGLGHAARSRAAKLGVWSEGDAARYHAHNGSEYRVDVGKMMQTKLATGSRRAVIRETLPGFGVAWSFESSARRKAGQLDQIAVYVQYPTEVCAVLEHRYRAYCTSSLAAKQNPKSMEAVDAAVQKLNNAGLRAIFGLGISENNEGTGLSTESSDDHCKSADDDAKTASATGSTEQCSTTPTKWQYGSALLQASSESGTELSATSGDDCSANKYSKSRRAVALQVVQEAVASCGPKPPSNTRKLMLKNAARLASRVSAAEPLLGECLFDRVLQSGWKPNEVAAAVRWLHKRGFQCKADHCRKAALIHGSLAVLRVLLVEARVDVRGLELLASAPVASSRGQAAAKGGNGNSWVQRCKPAVKMLLARGAILGGTTHSKLLKRLEEDATVLLKARVLAALCEDLPDMLLGHIGDFAGVPAPFAWRDFQWGERSTPAD